MADSEYTGCRCGAGYTPPEAQQGHPLTPAADVFQFGGLCFFMAVGSPPPTPSDHTTGTLFTSPTPHPLDHTTDTLFTSPPPTPPHLVTLQVPSTVPWHSMVFCHGSESNGNLKSQAYESVLLYKHLLEGITCCMTCSLTSHFNLKTSAEPLASHCVAEAHCFFVQEWLRFCCQA